MKKFLFILALLLLVACSNDDDNNNGNPQNNVLRIADVEFELKAGVIEDFGLYEADLYNFDIVLINSNIIEVGGEPFPEEQFVTGIYFELFTNSEDDLTTGTYNLVDSDEISNQTFEFAEIVENVDVTSNEETGQYTELVSGTLEVLSNAPVYEFEFSGIDSSGRNISGYYKGDLSSLESVD
jgi:hypothetical protein